MKVGLKHILFAMFIVSFALGVRTVAITFENDGITGIGALAAPFVIAMGITILKTNRWLAWLAGSGVTFAMCTMDTIERANMNPQMEYLWSDPMQGQHATDPEIGMIVTLVFTLFATIISAIGVGAGTLYNKHIDADCTQDGLKPSGSPSIYLVAA